MSSIADCDLKIVPLSLSELDHVSGGFIYFFRSDDLPGKPPSGIPYPSVPSGPGVPPNSGGSSPDPTPPATPTPPANPTPPPAPAPGGGGGGGGGFPNVNLH